MTGSKFFLLLFFSFLFSKAVYPQMDMESDGSVSKNGEVPASKKKLYFVIGEYPPYASAFQKNQGISIYLVKEAFKRVGQEIEVDFLPWSLSLIEAKKGQTFNGSLLWSKTPKREEDFLFSDVVLEQIVVFFHRKKEEFKWKKFKDLKGKAIGTTMGYSYGTKMDLIIKKGLLKTVPTAEIISNLRRLIKGSIDLFPVEPTIAKYYLKKIGEKDPISANLLAFHKKPVHYYKLHLILNKTKDGNKEIISTFNKGLKSLKELLGDHTVTRPCLSLAKGVEAKNEEAMRHLKYIKGLCP